MVEHGVEESLLQFESEMSLLTLTTTESMSWIECGHPGNFPVDVVSKSFLEVATVVWKLENSLFVFSPTMCGVA